MSLPGVSAEATAIGVLCVVVLKLVEMNLAKKRHTSYENGGNPVVHAIEKLEASVVTTIKDHDRSCRERMRDHTTDVRRSVEDIKSDRRP